MLGEEVISTSEDLFRASMQRVKRFDAGIARTAEMLHRTSRTLTESLQLIQRSDELASALVPIRPHPNAYSLRL